MYLFFLFIFLMSTSSPSLSQNLTAFNSFNSPWRPNQNKLLISPNSSFAAGFRPLPTSQNLYTFPVWYNNISKKESISIWSANVNSPAASDDSLVITSAGQLCLVNSSGPNLWPQATTGDNSTSLMLRDYGNLIYRGWGSFDHPTDTILPTLNINNGTEIVSRNGKFRFLNSSKLVFQSSNGSYLIFNNAFQKLDEAGRINQVNGGSYITSDFGDTQLRRLKLDDDRNMRVYSFDESKREWTVVWQVVQELCLIHGLCCENAICMDDGSSNLTTCVCPPGFKRKTGSANYDCERKVGITDPQKTKFLQLDYVKL